MICLIVAVAASGFLSCSSGEPLGILSPADARQQYTVVAEGKPGFCVAGTTMQTATDTDWAFVRSYLQAHAEPCRANPAEETGWVSWAWHSYFDTTPAGQAAQAVDHRVEYAFGLGTDVVTKDGVKHNFPPGTTVAVMTEAITRYYVDQQTRADRARAASK